MRHSITTAFLCAFFLIASLVNIGTTHQMTTPITIVIILILSIKKEKKFYLYLASSPIKY